MFYGLDYHALDDKGRLAIPARHRAMLSGQLYLCRGDESCLELYPQAQWDEKTARFKSLPTSNPDVRNINRFLFNNTYQLELDKQGRIIIPQSERDFAALSGNVRIGGVLSHLEIWNIDRYNELEAQANSIEEKLSRELRLLGTY